MIAYRQPLSKPQTMASPYPNAGNGPSPMYPMYPMQTAPQASPMPMPGFQAQSAQTPPPFPGGAQLPPVGLMPTAPAQPVFEESYIENILRLNLGKTATVYMTFENNSEWNAKIFKGRIEAAGRDHLIISDPATGMRYLLLMVNLDYITFDEPLNYEYPGVTGVSR